MLLLKGAADIRDSIVINAVTYKKGWKQNFEIPRAVDAFPHHYDSSCMFHVMGCTPNIALRPPWPNLLYRVRVT